LGTFGTNDFSGVLGVGRLNEPLPPEAQWPDSLMAMQAADRMGFEALVSVSTWPANSFDTMTWAGAAAAVTQRALIFATVDMSVVHPVMAARQLASIDQISGGRVGANLVAGWRRPLAEAYGVDLLDHDRRYDRAEEWLDLARRFWTTPLTEEIHFDGEFFKSSLVTDATQPKPLQQPAPPIMNAGSSERGYRFMTEYADLGFIPNIELADLEVARQRISAVKELASRHGREIQVWTYFFLLSRDTERETEEHLQEFIRHRDNPRDRAAAQEEMERIRAETHTYTHLSEEEWNATRDRVMSLGMHGHPLVGPPDQIVEQLMGFSDAGLDGVLFVWPCWRDDIPYFEDRILPRMEQAGLRAASSALQA